MLPTVATDVSSMSMRAIPPETNPAAVKLAVPDKVTGPSSVMFELNAAVDPDAMVTEVTTAVVAPTACVNELDVPSREMSPAIMSPVRPNEAPGPTVMMSASRPVLQVALPVTSSPLRP